MTAAIQTHNLSKRYGDVLAVDGVNLRVDRGEIYAFLGLNGAGKTTTIRAMLGMIRPSTGGVSLFGEPIRHGGRGPWRRVGHLVETPAAYPELTVRENLGPGGCTALPKRAPQRASSNGSGCPIMPAARPALSASRPAKLYRGGVDVCGWPGGHLWRVAQRRPGTLNELFYFSWLPGSLYQKPVFSPRAENGFLIFVKFDI